MNITLSNISGLRVTVMGLGLHGGGLASALFFSKHGAQVTVTDLRSGEVLAPSIEKLKGLPIRFVLGRHDIEDFRNADVVIKNPAVPVDSPYLQPVKQLETDISVFLRIHQGPVAAITGTKGKSTTATVLHHLLKSYNPEARLGGNITVSPLTFLCDGTSRDAPVVLELSSWQLGDLRGKGILSPDLAIITNILRDHQNRYRCMDDYIADKMVLFEDMRPGQKAIFNYDDPVLRERSGSVDADVRYVSAGKPPSGINGAYLDENRGMRKEGAQETLLFDSPPLTGLHNHMNLLAAALGAWYMGVPGELIQTAAKTVTGLAHRLEFVRKVGGVSFYNDSAATIPDASVAAAASFNRQVILIMGGTDKELDFRPLEALKDTVREVYLLQGSATAKIVEELYRAGIPHSAPFASLTELLSSIMSHTEKDDIVVFSPGCTSFEMFLNEFDRGERFKSLVEDLPE